MTAVDDIDDRFQECMAALRDRGQQHVLRWWDELDRAERLQLLADLESIPWNLIDPLISTHVLETPKVDAPTDLQPPQVYRRQPALGQEALYKQARESGRALIGAGKVAAFTVAGGQGTRLGFDGPKGAVYVTPVGNKTLFELFGETVQAARRRYDTAIPWYIMTSPANHAPTVRFLSDRDFFGLPESDVVLFSQGMLPAFDFHGRLLLESKSSVALAPDGHGGSLKALVTSGALDDMRARGLEIISYFQIDNPLVKPFDPLFVGLHALTRSEMSTKVASKADDLEKVGNCCMRGGKLAVVEYSDFPDALAHERNADGSRKFDTGNLAIHLLNIEFVNRVVGRSFQIPFRRAEKRVSTIDDSGTSHFPTKPNAVKLEMFVFDALPLASDALLLEVDRAEEFSPVKNATGVDSLETAKQAQVARACRWLETAGVKVPRNADGGPDVTIAIAPSFALDAQDVVAGKAELPNLRRGDVIYIE